MPNYQHCCNEQDFTNPTQTGPVTYNRISARRGQIVNLNTQFIHSGQLQDPYAIKKISIYKNSINPVNLISMLIMPDVSNQMYPLPLIKNGIGSYTYPFVIPDDAAVPDVYLDVWEWFPTNPLSYINNPTDITSGLSLNSSLFDPYVMKCCNRFWVYPDEWSCSDLLQSMNFGFEPLTQKFNTPECRYLEIGYMPLPLYDYNHGLMNPIMPYVSPTITISTLNYELLVDEEPMIIGLRQGSYRSNPYVAKYLMNTKNFLRGTYQYSIKLNLPDGTTRRSDKFMFTIK